MAERPSPEEIILYEKDRKTKIATITFNRPEFLNAPTSMARLRYADILRAANTDNDVKVVIIRTVVVLPAPFGPTTTVSAPRSKARSISSRTGRLPRRQNTPRATRDWAAEDWAAGDWVDDGLMWRARPSAPAGPRARETAPRPVR